MPVYYLVEQRDTPRGRWYSYNYGLDHSLASARLYKKQILAEKLACEVVIVRIDSDKFQCRVVR